MNDHLSRFLDFARWTSALMVVITHTNNRFGTRLMDIPPSERTAPLYALSFLSGFAHQAVVVFFVLSGYLVGGKLFARIRGTGEFDAKRYLIDRVVRIYLVLLPTIAIVYVLDVSGSTFFAGSGVYQNYGRLGDALTESSFDLQSHHSPTALAGVLLNVQQIFTPSWGTDGPLGTLANEFWYYLTFPLLMFPLMNRKKWHFRLIGFVIGVLLLTCFTYAKPLHGTGFLVWCVGVAAAVISKPLTSNHVLAYGMLVFVLLFERIMFRASAWQNIWQGLLLDLALAIGFGQVIVCLKVTSVPAPRFLNMRLHKAIADFSYSLYAYHVSFLTFLCAALQQHAGFGWQTMIQEPIQFAAFFGLIVATLGGARVLALISEDHTHRVRRWVYNKCGVTGNAR